MPARVISDVPADSLRAFAGMAWDTMRGDHPANLGITALRNITRYAPAGRRVRLWIEWELDRERNQDETEPATLQAFHGVNGELVAAHHDEDGVMLRADFHGSKLSASTARELAHHLNACADQADDWMRDAADLGPVSPSPWGHPEPAPADDPDEPTNRDIEPEPDGWHDGPDPEPN